ncbi:probable cytochrome P450 6a13 [Halyomorpha halys]|uniref:probable cytochrome P450 6a13 n=1 Tax=Halyomorpha halys TaxID=286706 RepID=UPI0006D50B44|nr:probable cytochrome P450 6a13 [Halyomorpha halys]
MYLMFESLYADLLFVVLTFLFLLYRFSTATYGYWAERGVPFVPPVPLFGNSLTTALGIHPLVTKQRMNYDYFGENRFGGTYAFRRPTFFIKDPELVEQVLIKDFSTFYNRGLKVDTKLDPLSNHLVNLEDNQWKSLRNKLTPAFSSNKMKIIHEQLLECSDKLVECLSTFEQTGQPFDTKAIMAKFTVFVIGSIAFGLSLNTLTDPECEFCKMGDKLFKPTFLGRLRFALRSQFPKLMRLLNWKGLPKETEKFFFNLVKNTVDFRERNNIQRNDFLQILMELRKQDQLNNGKDEIKFDEELMTANAFVFFLAGYDTTATTISFMLFELAQNSEIQEQVYNEIQEKIKKYNGVPTYEAVKEMAFLDKVLSETLRMYPPASAIVREARSPYHVPDSSLVLPKGSMVFIPIYSLQHDAKYYPEPDKFDPTRFDDEDRIIKGTYLPFGDGPRICIGQRLAKVEVKVAVIKILMTYKLSVNEQTIRPLKYHPKTLFLTPIGGLWLNLTRRI